jgi:glutathionylspermidine synthase
VLRGRCDASHADLFYDVEDRKFVRGRIYANSAFYRLRTGRKYVEILYYRNWLYDPPAEVSAAIVEISDDLYLDAVSCVVYSNSEFVLNNREIPKQIKDLVRVKDIERGSVVALFDRVYDESENKKLLEFVLGRKEIVEQK